MNSISQIIQNRKIKLLREFGSGNPLVAVESPQKLGYFKFLDGFADDHEVQKLGRFQEKSVVISHAPNQSPDLASVWVRQSYTNYRKAYIGFLKQIYKVDVPVEALAHYDIDHLVSKGQVNDASMYHRIEAIPSDVNSNWGRNYEKKVAGTEISKKDSSSRLMNYLTAAKLSGQLPPSGPEDLETIRKIATNLKKNAALTEPIELIMGHA